MTEAWAWQLASDAGGPRARLEEVAVVAAGDGEAPLLLVVLEEVPRLALVRHVGPEGHRVPVRVVPQVATLGEGRVHALHPGAGIDLEHMEQQDVTRGWDSFCSVVSKSQMICDRRFYDYDVDSRVNLGQFW